MALIKGTHSYPCHFRISKLESDSAKIIHLQKRNWQLAEIVSRWLITLIMKWMIIFASAVFVAVSLAPAYAQPPLPPMAPPPSGTCASIGYSMSCCPQSLNRADCRAIDGTCNCGHDCHLDHNRDCCSDIACPRRKYTINFCTCICTI